MPRGRRPRDAGIWGEIGYRVEKALRRREQRIEHEQQRLTQFLAAIEASPIGVLLLDANDQISWCNRVAADHFGLDPKRDIAQPVTNLVRAPAFVEHLQRRAHRAAGELSPGPHGSRLSALVQPYGDGLKLVLTQDITERERAEAMRRDFVANVSHEIRTPLTVLAGFVETMSELPLTEAERKRVLTLMTQQTQRMQTLVADLLTLAQLEGSPRPPADRWVAVAELLERAQGRRHGAVGRAARAARSTPATDAAARRQRGRTAQRAEQPGDQRGALHARGRAHRGALVDGATTAGACCASATPASASRANTCRG